MELKSATTSKAWLLPGAFLIPLALLVVADLNLSIRILIGQIVAIDVKIIFVFFLQKGHYWVFLLLVVLGGELAVPFTRNPLNAGLNSRQRT